MTTTYKRYEMYQKYKNNKPVEPQEFIKGNEIITTSDVSNLFDCKYGDATITYKNEGDEVIYVRNTTNVNIYYTLVDNASSFEDYVWVANIPYEWSTDKEWIDANKKIIYFNSEDESLNLDEFNTPTYINSLFLPHVETIRVYCNSAVMFGKHGVYINNVEHLKYCYLDIPCIKRDCFNNCPVLEEIVLSNTLNGDFYNCFNNCPNLKYIDLRNYDPFRLYTIRQNLLLSDCFNNCPNLIEIKCTKQLKILLEYKYPHLKNKTIIY